MVMDGRIDFHMNGVPVGKKMHVKGSRRVGAGMLMPSANIDAWPH